MTFFSLI
jgi:hypothetical protein